MRATLVRFLRVVAKLLLWAGIGLVLFVGILVGLEETIGEIWREAAYDPYDEVSPILASGIPYAVMLDEGITSSILAVALAGTCLFYRFLCRIKGCCPECRTGFAWAAGLCLALALLIPIGLASYGCLAVNRYGIVREPDHWLSSDSPWKMRSEPWWFAYRPFQPGNRLAKAAPDPAFLFTGEPPRICGAYALYPAYAAAFQALVAEPPRRLSKALAHEYLALDGSDMIFKLLNDGKTDLLFGLRPSPEQLAAMRGAKLCYTLTPVLRSAFVFFVHKDNPASSLTQDQLRAIYSGHVTKWRELGVPLDAPLRPYQRNKDSGSQTRFERFMGNTPIMPPPRELVIDGMREIIELVADYRNSPGALGFSFRFFVTELIKNPNIKLLAIDGVEPTVANIQSGIYPLISEAYAITARPREGNVAKMVAFFRSPEGRRLVEASGYVPVPEDAEDSILE